MSVEGLNEIMDVAEASKVNDYLCPWDVYLLGNAGGCQVFTGLSAKQCLLPQGQPISSPLPTGWPAGTMVRQDEGLPSELQDTTLERSQRSGA